MTVQTSEQSQDCWIQKASVQDYVYKDISMRNVERNRRQVIINVDRHVCREGIDVVYVPKYGAQYLPIFVSQLCLVGTCSDLHTYTQY